MSEAVVIPPRSRGILVKRLIIYSLLIAIAALFFIPFIWSVSTSFKTLPDTQNFSFIPKPWTLSGWKTVWTQYDFKLYIRNSFFLAVVITTISLALSSLGGYAFARLRFPGRELLFFLVLGTLMIPDQLRLIPVFVMLTNWHLIASFKGYILINLVSATNLFFMRQYFLTIPKDYEEAAKLDNAGFFKTYWKVMLPLAGPALAAITILSFQGTWNDFYWQLILLQDDSKFTLNVGIARFATSSAFNTDWPALMAVATISIAPVALLYIFFQRYFVAGVTTAGVKG